MLTDAQKQRVAELHAEDRRRSAEWREAYRRNRELNALLAARRDPDNDLLRDEAHENGAEEDDLLRRRGYVGEDGI